MSLGFFIWDGEMTLVDEWVSEWIGLVYKVNVPCSAYNISEVEVSIAFSNSVQLPIPFSPSLLISPETPSQK